VRRDGCGHHDLDARYVSKHRLERLGVLRARAAAGACLRPEHDRDRERSGGHVAELRGLVENRVETHSDEVMNMISTIGRRPVIAAPTAAPT